MGINPKDLIKGMTFGGYPVKISESSIQLGLKVLQKVTDYESENIENRYKKATKAAYSSLAKFIDKRSSMNFELIIICFNSIVNPTLISGLNVIPISEKGFKRLATFQNDWLRRAVGAKSWTPTTVLSVMLKQIPVKTQIHLQMASLFHNIWVSIPRI